MKVALFITCLADQFYPHVGVAVTSVLERFGCEVIFPGGQTCCGQPFYNNGYQAEARELARRWVEKFERYDHIVTPSASCCAMVREHYPQLLGKDPAWSSAVEKVKQSTFEFVEFLDRVIRPNVATLSLPTPTTCTHHHTCHSRLIGMKDESLRMLCRIGNVRYVAMEKSDQCCGFGGTFAAKYPEVSGAIVEDKVRCIEACGAETVVCNESGCAMNIAGTLHRRGSKVRVRHLAELLAEAMQVSK
jgi:L-lactate dehydrogenase complex protein LldE